MNLTFVVQLSGLRQKRDFDVLVQAKNALAMAFNPLSAKSDVGVDVAITKEVAIYADEEATLP